MLSDPLSVTYGGSARSMPRVGNTATSATYRSSDGNFSLRTFQTPISKGQRYRRGITFGVRKIAADPFLTGVNAEFAQTFTLTFNVPVLGFTSTEMVDGASGFMAFLQANTAAVATELATGQI